MISVVLYGRNDSYGYNLHKRAALSLNCIAEVLDDPDDEILFVDYNTPDDFPTFPEAIQDTLTAKAKARLRILRARPSLHERFKGKTHLQALEPVARNIAIRRSNPANRWILSTNTDMIFVPRRGESLSAMVRDLPKGYYGIPRFELPESLWETLDRYDAAGTIEKVGAWGWQFHLNEIVYGAPTIKFDAPGDFQLMDRADLFKIHGFNEEMLLGWHVDSNICKRLFMLYGQVGELTDRLFGYHCDHTRQVTPAHKRTAVENSISKFMDNVAESGVQAQADTWGCADAKIEDIRIEQASGHGYIGGLEAAIKAPMAQTSAFAYVRETYDKVDYEASHILPYLTDVLASAPRSWNVAWFGINKSMFDLFRTAWEKMGFEGRILLTREDAGLFNYGNATSVQTDFVEILSKADVFIFDFGALDGKAFGGDGGDFENQQLRHILQSFLETVKAEQKRGEIGKALPRRVIAINAIHNRFEPLVRGFIEFARSPFSSRLRHGYVLPASKGSVSWLGLMTVKSAGERIGDSIKARQMIRGGVFSGPHVILLPGKYTIELQIETIPLSFPRGWASLLFVLLFKARSSKPGLTNSDDVREPVRRRVKFEKQSKYYAAAVVEIRTGDQCLFRRKISIFELWFRSIYRFKFAISSADLDVNFPEVKVNLWSSGQLGFFVRILNLHEEPANGRYDKSLPGSVP